MASLVTTADPSTPSFAGTHHPLYFRQLLSGRDHCTNPDPSKPHQQMIFQYAKSMQNYQYLVGDAITKECVVIDPCWDVEGIVQASKFDGMNIVAGLATHYHFDHVGGRVPKWMKRRVFQGHSDTPSIVPGVKEIHDMGAPVYIHSLELKKLSDDTGVPRDALRKMKQDQIIMVGKTHLRVIHTPGHSGGSVCLLVTRDGGQTPDLLISGDTIFPGSCGRTDLPESNSRHMMQSLMRLSTDATLIDSLKVYGGHAYSGPFTTIGEERERGVLNPFAMKRMLGVL